MTRSLLTGLALFAGFASSATAQDVHHWSQQYGTQQTLLGGAASARARDAAAVYYNPGALALITDDSVTASGNAYARQSITVKGAAGLRGDQAANDTLVLPGLLGGVYTSGDGATGSQALGFAVLTRAGYDTRLSGRDTRTQDILLGAPGTETFVTQADFRSSVAELWAGVAYAARLHDYLSVGLTGFVTWRSHAMSSRVASQAYPSTLGPAGATAERRREMELEYAAMVWKASAATEVGPFALHLAVTAPSIGLGGDGQYTAVAATTNVDFDSDGIADPLSTDVRDGNADTHWHRSGGAAFGLSLDVSPVQFHATVEWFAPTPRYAVMRTDEPSGGATPAAARSALTHSERGVVNFALAAEWKAGDALTCYAGFRSDYSPVDAPSDSDVSLGSYDLWHATVGVGWTQEQTQLTLGVTVTWGDGRLVADADFAAATEGSRLLGGSSEADLDYFAVAIVLGYTIRFK